MGVLLYLLLSGTIPFYGKTSEETKEKLLEGSVKYTDRIWNRISPEAKDLISKMLQYSPESRISVNEALDHPWIKKFMEPRSPLDRQLSIGLSNLSNFETQKTLQKAVLAYISSQALNREEEESIKSLFSAIDKNKDGKICLEELIDGYLALNIDREVAIVEAKRIMARVDINQNEYIDYNEFLMTNLAFENVISEDKLKTAFEYFDSVFYLQLYRIKMDL